jgi:hypothetical protein
MFEYFAAAGATNIEGFGVIGPKRDSHPKF